MSGECDQRRNLVVELSKEKIGLRRIGAVIRVEDFRFHQNRCVDGGARLPPPVTLSSPFRLPTAGTPPLAPAARPSAGMLEVELHQACFRLCRTMIQWAMAQLEELLAASDLAEERDVGAADISFDHRVQHGLSKLISVLEQIRALVCTVRGD